MIVRGYPGCQRQRALVEQSAHVERVALAGAGDL
jgi:hypothetical protein